MPAPVNFNLPVAPLAQPDLTRPATKDGSAGAFGEIFRQSVDKVEQYHHNAGNSIERFMSGEDEELHKVAIATQQAELAFEMFVQVRNKVVNAYQEVMRMQL